LNTSIATGHSKTVRALTWSPSGNTLATGSFDSNVGIWQQVGGEGEGEWECVSSLEGHETECKGVAYSASGTLLASCSRDKSVWVWEVLPDADFECMGVLMEHSQDVKSVAWHPREEILASCSYDDTIRIWVDDPQDDWDCVAILRGHTSTVWSISFSPDGNYIASGSDDRTVRIWKRVQEYKWECVQVLEGYHDRMIFSVAWGEGKVGSLGWIASASSDGQIIVYQVTGVERGIEARELTRATSAHGVYDVNSVAWCPRKGLENYLGSCGDDGSVRVWKVQVGK